MFEFQFICVILIKLFNSIKFQFVFMKSGIKMVNLEEFFKNVVLYLSFYF